jgi:hypothetical protein
MLLRWVGALPLMDLPLDGSTPAAVGGGEVDLEQLQAEPLQSNRLNDGTLHESVTHW